MPATTEKKRKPSELLKAATEYKAVMGRPGLGPDIAAREQKATTQVGRLESLYAAHGLAPLPQAGQDYAAAGLTNVGRMQALDVQRPVPGILTSTPTPQKPAGTSPQQPAQAAGQPPAWTSQYEQRQRLARGLPATGPSAQDLLASAMRGDVDAAAKILPKLPSKTAHALLIALTEKEGSLRAIGATGKEARQTVGVRGEEGRRTVAAQGTEQRKTEDVRQGGRTAIETLRQTEAQRKQAEGIQAKAEEKKLDRDLDLKIADLNDKRYRAIATATNLTAQDRTKAGMIVRQMTVAHQTRRDLMGQVKSATANLNSLITKRASLSMQGAKEKIDSAAMVAVLADIDKQTETERTKLAQLQKDLATRDNEIGALDWQLQYFEGQAGAGGAGGPAAGGAPGAPKPSAAGVNPPQTAATPEALNMFHGTENVPPRETIQITPPQAAPTFAEQYGPGVHKTIPQPMTNKTGAQQQSYWQASNNVLDGVASKLAAGATWEEAKKLLTPEFVESLTPDQRQVLRDLRRTHTP